MRSLSHWHDHELGMWGKLQPLKFTNYRISGPSPQMVSDSLQGLPLAPVISGYGPSHESDRGLKAMAQTERLPRKKRRSQSHRGNARKISPTFLPLVPQPGFAGSQLPKSNSGFGIPWLNQSPNLSICISELFSGVIGE
jgi:hypothetical protein